MKIGASLRSDECKDAVELVFASSSISGSMISPDTLTFKVNVPDLIASIKLDERMGSASSKDCGESYIRPNTLTLTVHVPAMTLGAIDDSLD